MKKGLVLSLVLVSALFGSISFAKKRVATSDDGVQRVSSAKPLCKDGVCGKHTKKCSCYCSVLCGPRKIQPQDSPRFVDEKEAEELGIPSQCYCQQSDIDNHVKNCIEGKEQEVSAEEQE